MLVDNQLSAMDYLIDAQFFSIHFSSQCEQGKLALFNKGIFTFPCKPSAGPFPCVGFVRFGSVIVYI